MENTTAPAEASEANTNTNSETLSEASNGSVEAVQTANTTNNANPNTITLTDEQKRFFDANGGLEKVFSRMKEAVSNPLPKQQTQAQSVEQKTVEQPQNVPQYQQRQIPKGYITPEEYMTEQYFKSLSNEEKYSGIADQIRNGDVLKEMAEFGIRPTQDGMFNDGQIRKFLDLKAQTVPAQQTTAPITNTPTVEWSPVDKVESFEQAQKIIQENISRPGMEHPKTAEAKEFLRNFYKR